MTKNLQSTILENLNAFRQSGRAVLSQVHLYNEEAHARGFMGLAVFETLFERTERLHAELDALLAEYEELAGDTLSAVSPSGKAAMSRVTSPFESERPFTTARTIVRQGRTPRAADIIRQEQIRRGSANRTKKRPPRRR